MVEDNGEQKEYMEEMVKTLKIEIEKLQKENEVLRYQKIGKRVKPEEVVEGKDYLFRDSGGTWWCGIGNKAEVDVTEGTIEKIVIYVASMGPDDPEHMMEIYELPE